MVTVHRRRLLMEVGDFFPIDGYHVMAKASFDHGDMVIFCNESNYLLVGSVVEESMTDGEPATARLEGAFKYAGEEESDADIYQIAYQKALALMVELTLGRC